MALIPDQVFVKTFFIFEIFIVFPLANYHALLASNKNISKSDWSISFLGLSKLVISLFSISINLLPKIFLVSVMLTVLLN